MIFFLFDDIYAYQSKAISIMLLLNNIRTQ